MFNIIHCTILSASDAFKAHLIVLTLKLAKRPVLASTHNLNRFVPSTFQELSLASFPSNQGLATTLPKLGFQFVSGCLEDFPGEFFVVDRTSYRYGADQRGQRTDSFHSF